MRFIPARYSLIVFELRKVVKNNMPMIVELQDKSPDLMSLMKKKRLAF